MRRLIVLLIAAVSAPIVAIKLYDKYILMDAESIIDDIKYNDCAYANYEINQAELTKVIKRVNHIACLRHGRDQVRAAGILVALRPYNVVHTE